MQFGAQAQILRELDLQIAPGEILALVGASGCGKSTLLRAIAGLVPPSAGSIQFSAGATGKMSYVFQDATLLPWRTVIENVRLPLELRRSHPDISAGSAEHQTSQISEVLHSVGLEPSAWHRYPRELSGGMRMRASIARALVTNPEILLLDEPFAALDDLLRIRLNELLLELWHARPRTVLFVTHNIAEAVYMSHRIAVFGRGRIATLIENQLDWPRAAEQRTELKFAEQYGAVSHALSRAGV